MMAAVCDAAKASGTSVARVLSDPNAAPWYERWHARLVGGELSATFPGRALPVSERDLLDRDRP
jgi:hypothetical protein